MTGLTDSEPAATQLLRQLRRTIDHVKAGTIPQTDSTVSIPTMHYTDPQRWQSEVSILFKRGPLMLALSCEMAQPGDYKAMEVCGVKLILCRGRDDIVRSFINMCSHRGAQLVDEGGGSARRFTCPYHAWSYDQDGSLVGVTNRHDFGEIDMGCLGLTPLPVEERHGLIWGILTPGVEFDLTAHLAGYGTMLDHFDFARWYSLGSQRISGPNWKLAYDGYLDFYHIPFLHRETFGPDFSSRPIYDSWGPHTRMTAHDETVLTFEDVPDNKVDLSKVDGGVWTIFPHVSIAGFPVGDRGMMISQLFPGDSPSTSMTIQNFITTSEPDAELLELAEKTKNFYHHVVRDEDYFTGIRIGENIVTGAKDEFLFGRNEGGNQHFHRTVDRLVAAG